MKHDERERIERRANDQWARRMRSLEREFERVDRAKQPNPARQSLPIAILSGVIVIVVAILFVRSASDAGRPQTSAPPIAPAANGPFIGTPADNWRDAATAFALPRAAQAGPFTASEVAEALARARTYLLTARTNSDVLTKHRVGGLRSMVDAAAFTPVRGRPIQAALLATFLAPRNTLVAPVRLLSDVTYRYVPRSGTAAARLVVSANLVWAYALKAAYPVAQIPTNIVAIHERVELSFYPSKPSTQSTSSGPAAKPYPSKDDAVWYDTDCGYFKQVLLALPRANDPNALPGFSNGVNPNQAFELTNDVNVSSHVCRDS